MAGDLASGLPTHAIANGVDAGLGVITPGIFILGANATNVGSTCQLHSESHSHLSAICGRTNARAHANANHGWK